MERRPMKTNFDRRAFCRCVAAASSACVAVPALTWAQDQKTNVSTPTYKKVGSLEIKADVHRPSGTERPPVVVWIHGGALIMGHREGIDGRLKNRLLQSGVALISIDYRLAPETKLPAII